MATLWYDGQPYFVADDEVRLRKVQIARTLAKGEPGWLKLGEVELLIMPGIAFSIRWEGSSNTEGTASTEEAAAEIPGVSDPATPDIEP
jgi:hypothetical protein